MKNHLLKILLVSMLLMLLVAACQANDSDQGPDEAYWKYYQACEDGKFQLAELYLDEGAVAQIDSIGVCGFTHDAINRYETERGGTERTFSEEPIVEFNENRAAMTWVDDQGNLAVVQLINTVEGWKVAHTTWSK